MIMTTLYAIMSLATFALLLCMLADTMTDSHFMFRLFLLVTAAGCVGTAITVWLPNEAPSLWQFVRGAGLLGMFAMMRGRQIKGRGGRGEKAGRWSRLFSDTRTEH